MLGWEEFAQLKGGEDDGHVVVYLKIHFSHRYYLHQYMRECVHRNKASYRMYESLCYVKFMYVCLSVDLLMMCMKLNESERSPNLKMILSIGKSLPLVRSL